MNLDPKKLSEKEMKEMMAKARELQGKYNTLDQESSKMKD